VMPIPHPAAIDLHWRPWRDATGPPSP